MAMTPCKSPLATSSPVACPGRRRATSPRRTPRPAAACGSSAWTTPGKGSSWARNSASSSLRRARSSTSPESPRGKGYAGAIKRWNFRSQDASHGNSVSHRAPGSIGNAKHPGESSRARRWLANSAIAGHRAEPHHRGHRPGETSPPDQGRRTRRTGCRHLRSSGHQATTRGRRRMSLSVASVAGDPLEVSEATFGCAFNEALVHQAVVAYLAGGRSGSRAQKSRGEVRGGGRKPHRQKRTGRARAGSFVAPSGVAAVGRLRRGHNSMRSS